MKRDPTQNPYIEDDWYKQSLTIGKKSAVDAAKKAAADAKAAKKSADAAVKQAAINVKTTKKAVDSTK